MKTETYFKGKSVLITGGSSGIGFAFAKALVKIGAIPSLLARDERKLEQAKAEILISCPTAIVHTIKADVTKAEDLSQILAEHCAKYGTPEILINSAGVARPGYVEELPLEIYKWTMDIDYHGTVNMVKLLLPGMIERGSGHIINVSSIAGVIGVFGYTAYSGAKFAVKGFSDCLRTELKPKGITVSVLYPPDTDTPQLAWEDQFKPAETKAISGTAKPINPDILTEKALKDAAKGKASLLPNFESKLMYFVGTRLGNLVYGIMDLMVRNAQKKNKQ